MSAKIALAYCVILRIFAFDTIVDQHYRMHINIDTKFQLTASHAQAESYEILRSTAHFVFAVTFARVLFCYKYYFALIVTLI